MSGPADDALHAGTYRDDLGGPRLPATPVSADRADALGQVQASILEQGPQFGIGEGLSARRWDTTPAVEGTWSERGGAVHPVIGGVNAAPVPMVGLSQAIQGGDLSQPGNVRPDGAVLSESAVAPPLQHELMAANEDCAPTQPMHAGPVLEANVVTPRRMPDADGRNAPAVHSGEGAILLGGGGAEMGLRVDRCISPVQTLED